MALLDSYLDQITASSRAIGDLEFPPSKIFTNAILGNHEITSLIRDTEPHERSLFTVDPSISIHKPYAASELTSTSHATGVNRRKTIGQIHQNHGSVVARVLGNDMLRQIQQSSRSHARTRGVDVEILLLGAERLSTVCPVAGAKDRISKVRSRYSQSLESIAHYEKLVARQQAKTSHLNSDKDYHNQSEAEEQEQGRVEFMPALHEVDILAEETEIRELESKKKALEDRVAGMEKDLGGLLR